ncbi:alpha/beta fold hydrolase [Marinobacter zhejiangensis]|uniref:Pimeloyl-ACP methyl ester carboxylesterase n=1 Tax=Marinobacter zhejiangensis TaxID=488535 RepID=A0A1I4LJ93_9GAMM|nr:alpha/beta hydrolase [Marinobacter zhejiangensis]SFL91075.1 Pimeloyl-ACP methyl ester carboxylesterase [Marinobacter zhejiangensis]
MTIHMRNLSTATAPQTQPRNFQHEALRLGLQLYTRLSAEGAAKLVERLAFTPDRLPMPSRYEYLLDLADSHTQLHHGPHTLPIYSWGDGPTILGVHGWSGAGIQFGAYIEPLVAAGYRVVLYDAPAHGRAQGERTDLYEMTEVLAKVAHQVGPLHAIIAHSLGSIAAGRALVDGLDASRLVLLAPPASLSEVVNEMGHQMGLSTDALAEHRKRMETRFGGDVWQQLSLEELAPQLRQQGLVVIDSDDADVSADQSARVYHNWPDSELMSADGLGHHRMLRAPQVVDAVADFLTRDRVVPH